MCNHGMSVWCFWCVIGCVPMSAYYGIIVGTGIPTGITGEKLLALHRTVLHVVWRRICACECGSQKFLMCYPCSDLAEIYLDVFINSQLYISKHPWCALKTAKRKENMMVVEWNAGFSCRFSTGWRSHRAKVGQWMSDLSSHILLLHQEHWQVPGTRSCSLPFSFSLIALHLLEFQRCPSINLPQPPDRVKRSVKNWLIKLSCNELCRRMIDLVPRERQLAFKEGRESLCVMGVVPRVFKGELMKQFPSAVG